MAGTVAGVEPVVYVRVAGFFRRAAAAFVDALLCAPVVAICGILLRFVDRVPLPPAVADAPEFALELLIERHPLVPAALILVCTAALLYDFLFCALAGATPGMRLLGMRVVCDDGESPGMGVAVFRTLATALAAAPLALGLLWIAFDREKRGLHDHLARTYVVRAVSARRG